MSDARLRERMRALDEECDALKTRADIWQGMAERARLDVKRMREALKEAARAMRIESRLLAEPSRTILAEAAHAAQSAARLSNENL